MIPSSFLWNSQRKLKHVHRKNINVHVNKRTVLNSQQRLSQLFDTSDTDAKTLDAALPSLAFCAIASPPPTSETTQLPTKPQQPPSPPPRPPPHHQYPASTMTVLRRSFFALSRAQVAPIRRIAPLAPYRFNSSFDAAPKRYSFEDVSYSIHLATHLPPQVRIWTTGRLVKFNAARISYAKWWGSVAAIW